MSYNIFSAAKDLVTGKLEYAGGEEEVKRLDTCRPCEANMAGLCTACGCVIVAKVKLAKSECPMGLWGPV